MAQELPGHAGGRAAGQSRRDKGLQAQLPGASRPRMIRRASEVAASCGRGQGVVLHYGASYRTSEGSACIVLQ